MTKYTYEVYKDVKDYQKDLLEFLTENKQAGQSIENEINKLRNTAPGYEDIEFNDKIDFYNFLIERFYPNTSPMEVENLDPQLNKKIAKAIAKLMKRIA